MLVNWNFPLRFSPQCDTVVKVMDQTGGRVLPNVTLTIENEEVGKTQEDGTSGGKDIYLFISFSYHIGNNIQYWDIWYDIISFTISRHKIWSNISLWPKILSISISLTTVKKWITAGLSLCHQYPNFNAVIHKSETGN